MQSNEIIWVLFNTNRSDKCIDSKYFCRSDTQIGIRWPLRQINIYLPNWNCRWASIDDDINWTCLVCSSCCTDQTIKCQKELPFRWLQGTFKSWTFKWSSIMVIIMQMVTAIVKNVSTIFSSFLSVSFPSIQAFVTFIFLMMWKCSTMMTTATAQRDAMYICEKSIVYKMHWNLCQREWNCKMTRNSIFTKNVVQFKLYCSSKQIVSVFFISYLAPSFVLYHMVLCVHVATFEIISTNKWACMHMYGCVGGCKCLCVCSVLVKSDIWDLFRKEEN